MFKVKRIIIQAIVTGVLVFACDFLYFPGSSQRFFAKQVLAAIPGDCDGDGTVDLFDFGILVRSFGLSLGDSGYDDRCDFHPDNTIDLFDYGILVSNFGSTGPSNTPTSRLTVTPTRAMTSGPTATAAPTPPPGNWGIFPNCNAPAMPVEGQSWWTEKANPQPGDEIPFGRHIHAAACMPHARDRSGQMVNVRGIFEFTRVLLIHNSNLRLTKGDNGFPDDSGGAEFPVRFDPPKVCPNRGTNCVFYSNNRIDTTIRPDGLYELRWRIEGTHPDLSNNSEFISFASKIYIKNQGGSGGGPANNPNPRARGWYEGVEYDTAEISNYVELFRGRTDISVPVVSGVVPLQMNHTQSVGSGLRSKLYLDPNFHAGTSGTILYDKPGLFQGTYNLDTTRIPNGRHVLVAQTEHTVPSGIHSGLLRLFIDVNN